MSLNEKKIALFATCLVDLFKPEIGFAVLKIFEKYNLQIDVPTMQSCCGQPAYNSGAMDEARVIASKNIEVFEKYDYVVVPSGSCKGTIATHYPKLFDDVVGTKYSSFKQRAWDLSHKTFELTEFLVKIAKIKIEDAEFDKKVTYHSSCSSLRECNLYDEPISLLKSISKLNFIELDSFEECCGFGGLFSVKFPEVSNNIVEEKVANIEKTGAEVVTSLDLGCLLNIGGKLSRNGSNIKAIHIAELIDKAIANKA